MILPEWSRVFGAKFALCFCWEGRFLVLIWGVSGAGRYVFWFFSLVRVQDGFCVGGFGLRGLD